MSPTPSTGVKYPHVDINDGKIPIVAGTTMKVIELVMAQRAHGWSPEELRFQYPHLTMSQIHSALAYYWDHQEALDADIERRSLLVSEERGKGETSPLRQKLEALKHSG